MGFLMGAYGKLMAGQLVRNIQFQMLGIQTRLRRVTREIGEKTKLYEAQERNMKSQMQMQMQYSLYNYATMMGLPSMMPGSGQAGLNMSGQTCMMNIGAFSQTQMQRYSAMQMEVQMQFSQAQAMWQNMFDMQKHADLEALKDLESELQIENDNLKSQLEIAKQEYEAFKQEEKADAKGITPEYTPSQA